MFYYTSKRLQAEHRRAIEDNMELTAKDEIKRQT